LYAEKINTNWHLYQSGKRSILERCVTFGKPETISEKYHQNILFIAKYDGGAILCYQRLAIKKELILIYLQV
jgi:hypothetical protein